MRTAAEPTTACGGNREARLGQRSDFSRPRQGVAEKSASATRKARRHTSRRQKGPCGAFLDARLAQSTRAHQELRYPMGTGVSVLSALKKGMQGWIRTASTRRIVRRGKKPLCDSDDRCQRQKQGGAVGAAASRMRVPPKARCSRWEPRPGLLFCAARAIHPRPPKNRNVSKYAAVLFYDTFSCYFCFAHLSEQLC